MGRWRSHIWDPKRAYDSRNRGRRTRGVRNRPNERRWEGREIGYLAVPQFGIPYGLVFSDDGDY